MQFSNITITHHEALGFIVECPDGVKMPIQSEDQLVEELRKQLAQKEVRIVTLGHEGHQVRGWGHEGQIWRYLSDHRFGHFDSSEGKVFDCYIEDIELLNRALHKAMVDNRNFARFSYDERGSTYNGRPPKIKNPLAIFVPTD